MSNNFIKADHCLNCNYPLQGENFCPNCGQENNTRRLTLWHFISESLSHFFAFDGRFLLTLKTLFTSPGKVPREYVKGKRVRYMNPLKIYFLVSILLLALVQFQNGSKHSSLTGDKKESPALTDSIETADEGIPVEFSISGDDTSNVFNRLTILADFYKAYPDAPEKSGLDTLNLEPDFTNRFLDHQASKMARFDGDDFKNYFYSKLFWVLFLFLPITALMLKVLYIRRPFYYPEHLFFTFYSQTVFFITCILVLPFSDSASVVALVCFAYGIYLFLSMKSFYEQGTGKTILKFILLNLISIPSFILFFVLSTLVVFVLF